MNRDLQSIRRDYQFDDLTEDKAGLDPLPLFDSWLEEAITACPDDPTAMTLSTVDANGRPHGRVVLLKQRDDANFSFYTNYDSDKGQEIATNDNVALTFFWPALSRQVRIEGKATKVARATSESYFATRPKGSQIAASISRQSQVVSGREVLINEFAEKENQYQDVDTLPCPVNWGGYSVAAERIEFWQGRPSRLHDRIVFEHDTATASWKRYRKAP